MRISEEQYRQFLSKSIDYKQNKYKNKKVVYDGIKFDSKKEGAYYLKLKVLEEKGIIKNLQRQVKFELLPTFKFNGGTIRGISYYADFTYIQDDKLHIVDTKGIRTEVYKIKKKMMNYKGYEIEEI